MWINHPQTGSKTTLVNSRKNTRVSRSTGCLLHECPGCNNLWSLLSYRLPSQEPVLFRTSMVQQGGEMVRVISDARHHDHCWCGVPFPMDEPVTVSQATAVANVHSALRTALAITGEDSNVLDEIQILTTKVTSSMMRKLRGERDKRGTASA